MEVQKENPHASVQRGFAQGSCTSHIAGSPILQSLTGSELIDIDAVCAITGFRTKSSIYSRIKAAAFPRPVNISRRCSRWLLREVVAWVEAQAARRETV